MRLFHGQILEHAKLGAVVVLGSVGADRARVVTLEAWRTAPWLISKAEGGRLDIQPVEVPVTSLTPRPRREADLEDFMRTHHRPGWKPAPLPKPRKLPKLSTERFARLMLGQGARQVSE